VVEELGKGVEGFRVGQHVVVQPTLSCAEVSGSKACGACALEAENCCYQAGFVGLSGMAELMEYWNMVERFADGSQEVMEGSAAR